jgi:hypothetical protein
MTLLGKIFTVLIMVMSVVFMTFSVMLFATHTNWKVVALNSDTSGGKPLGLKPTLEAQIATNRQILQELDDTKAELAREQAARQKALAMLQTKSELLKAELAKSREALDALQTQHSEAVAKLGATTALLETVTTEVQSLRNDIVAVQSDRDDKLQRVVRLSDDINTAQRQLNNLKERQTQLQNQVSQYRMVLDKMGVRPGTSLDELPPTVDGEIVVANMAEGIFQVSLGMDDGLRTGHTLEVYRGANYLGKLRVVRVEPTAAVAEFVPGFRQAAIRKGDRVATRIN